MPNLKRILCSEQYHQTLKFLSAKEKTSIQIIVADALAMYFQHKNIEVPNEK